MSHRTPAGAGRLCPGPLGLVSKQPLQSSESARTYENILLSERRRPEKLAKALPAADERRLTRINESCSRFLIGGRSWICYFLTVPKVVMLCYLPRHRVCRRSRPRTALSCGSTVGRIGNHHQRGHGRQDRQALAVSSHTLPSALRSTPRGHFSSSVHPPLPAPGRRRELPFQPRGTQDGQPQR